MDAGHGKGGSVQGYSCQVTPGVGNVMCADFRVQGWMALQIYNLDLTNCIVVCILCVNPTQKRDEFDSKRASIIKANIGQGTLADISSLNNKADCHLAVSPPNVLSLLAGPGCAPLT